MPNNFLILQEDLEGLVLSLQDAYKNIIYNLIKLTLNETSSIDPLALHYMGVDENNPDFDYSALLDTTSYFWASKGGRGSLVEKTIALLTDSKANKKLHDAVNVSAVNPTFDIIKVTPDRLLLVEVKNRVDSGGTSARVEALKKFFNVFDNAELGSMKSPFKKIDMVFGLLYNLKGLPATFTDDKEDGFQSKTKSLMKEIKPLKDELTFVEGTYPQFTITTKYGDDFTDFLKPGLKVKDIQNTLFPRNYSDLKIALTVAIKERSLLLKNKNNIMTLLESLALTGSIETRLINIKKQTKIHFVYDDEYLINCIILHRVYQERKT